MVFRRGDQEAADMQTGYPHRVDDTYFPNDIQSLNGLAVFAILVTRPRKLAEHGNGVSGDDGARRASPQRFSSARTHTRKPASALLIPAAHCGTVSVRTAPGTSSRGDDAPNAGAPGLPTFRYPIEAERGENQRNSARDMTTR